MTDSQKIDRIYDLLMDNAKELAMLSVRQDQAESDIEAIKQITTSYVADRNKLTGAAWLGGALGGLGGLAGMGALILSWFKR